MGRGDWHNRFDLWLIEGGARNQAQGPYRSRRGTSAHALQRVELDLLQRNSRAGLWQGHERGRSLRLEARALAFGRHPRSHSGRLCVVELSQPPSHIRKLRVEREDQGIRQVVL